MPAERRKLNWTTILVAALAAAATGIPATIVALRTHDAVNHRMDELLLIAKRQAGDAATIAEQDAERKRQGVKDAAVLFERKDTDAAALKAYRRQAERAREMQPFSR